MHILLGGTTSIFRSCRHCPPKETPYFLTKMAWLISCLQAHGRLWSIIIDKQWAIKEMLGEKRVFWYFRIQSRRITGNNCSPQHLKQLTHWTKCKERRVFNHSAYGSADGLHLREGRNRWSNFQGCLIYCPKRISRSRPTETGTQVSPQFLWIEEVVLRARGQIS